MVEEETAFSGNENPASQFRYIIDRPTQTQREFAKNYDEQEYEDGFSAKKKLEKCARSCTCSLVQRILLSLFPMISWMKNYKLREWLPGDLVAGITLGVVHIPQSMAFSILAGLPPVFGLYTSFYPVLLYTFMGTSRHISVGTFPVTSLLTQSVIVRLTSSEEENLMLTNTTTQSVETTVIISETLFGLSPLDVRRVTIASTLMFLMGIFQLAFGILRLGFVTTYLSEPLIKAFTTGAAILIVTSQTPPILGIQIQSSSGTGAFFLNWIEIFRNFPNIHVATLVVSIVSIAILVAGREINMRFKEKMKIPLPTEVLVVVIAILASHFGMFKERFGVSIVDNIPTGLPAPRLIDASILSNIIGDAFAIAIVAFAISVSLAKMYAQIEGYSVDANQEFIAYGVSNVIPSFFSCFPNAAALSRCVIQHNTGGKTQLVGLLSSIIVLLTILLLGPIFEPLPRAVLGCIVVVGLFGILQQFTICKILFKLSKVDFMVWLVTLTAVVVLGVDIGLLAGVVFSMFTFIVRTQHPRCEVIANVRGTDLYRNCKTCQTASPHPGITIFKFHSTLYYANKDVFLSNLYQATGVNPDLAIAEEQEKREKLAKAITSRERRDSKWLKIIPCRNNETKPDDVEASECAASDNESKSNIDETLVELHSIIVDCSSFSFIDFVGVKTLKAVSGSYKKIGVQVLLADVGSDVRKALRLAGYYEIAGDDSEFVSVHDATIFAQYQQKSKVET